MRILIDARMYGLENSGIGRYIEKLIENLVATDKKNLFFILLRKKYFTLLKLPVTWKKVLADFPHYTIREQIYLPKIIESLNPDLVHFPNLNVSYFSKKPFIVTIHDLTMHRQKNDATTLPLPLYYAKRIPFLVVSKKSAVDSVKIIVPSNAVKREVLDYYNVDEKKIVVICEGVDINYFSDSLNVGVRRRYKIGGKYFIYTGNVYPHKNIKRAIEAINTLNSNSSEKYELLISSPRNVFLKKIERYIREVDAGNLVRILGFVPDKDLAELYNNSVAFVFPSLSEGFGLPGLEAMAAGTIVLASDIPVFKEIYEGNAFYFNPFDFSSISNSMKDALSIDQKKRVRIIRISQEFVKKYSWSKMAVETLRVYESCFGL